MEATVQIAERYVSFSMKMMINTGFRDFDAAITVQTGCYHAVVQAEKHASS